MCIHNHTNVTNVMLSKKSDTFLLIRNKINKYVIFLIYTIAVGVEDGISL